MASRPLRAVCCSGGGIRSAAFSLGGLQGLGRRPKGGGEPWLDGVGLITAVSGGSYIAASYAMVNRHLSPEQRAELPPYAPGSPEDNRLRAHTRYLVEDPRAAAVGVLSIVYGLVLNLIPILAGIFLVARGTGWLLRGTGILSPTRGVWEVHGTWTALLVAAVPAALAATVYVYDRLADIYRPPSQVRTQWAQAWTLRLLGAAAVVLALFVALPWLLRELSVTRVDVRPGPVDWRSQLAGFLATATTIVGLVKTSLGRFKSKLQVAGSAASNRVGVLVQRGVRAIAPWLGSAVVVGLLLVAFLTWVNSSAYTGVTAGQLWACAGALALLIGWQSTTDVNRNSVHAYYRSRLASAFAVRRTSDGDAEELPYDEPVRFSDLQADTPELVVCAAVNTTERGVVPSGRGCAPWTFSAHWTGISSGTMFDGEPGDQAHHRMTRAEEYACLAGEPLVTLPAAVAVSGAAVSPVMGRMTRAPLRLLLGFANVRLGLWLPNPIREGELPPAPTFGTPRGGGSRRRRDSVLAFLRWQWKQPGVRALLAEMLGQTGLTGRWVYVTDGGHYENLGLVEALRRGATEIIAFDASGDQPNSWTTFGEAIQTARADLGVEIDLDPTKMKPAAGSLLSPSLVVPGTCTYPNGVRARLWLCKLALPEKASWDVFAWANSHPKFPHDSTAQQLYGDREFEAYRRLGEVAALAAVNSYRRKDEPRGWPPEITLPNAIPQSRRQAPAAPSAAGALSGEEGIGG